MKKLLCATMISVATLASQSALAADKVAVVNMSEVFQQLPQRAVAAKKLEDEFKGRAAELQSEAQQLQEKVQRLKQGSNIKANDRSKLEKEIVTQRNALSTKEQAYDQDNRRRQGEERDKLVTRIQDAVKVIAKKKGYDLVIDSNLAAYFTQEKDITADVVKQVK